MKNIIIAGASGMVGGLILETALASPEISRVTSLVRRSSKQEHPKLKEVIISDFADYSKQADLFRNIDAGFFCIGVYTGQVPDDVFRTITVDYAIAFADAPKTNSSHARLCFLSGQGADRSEKSSMSFAKYKGIAENRIAETGLQFHTFRPGYIYPVTPRKEPNLMYRVSRMLYPLIRLMGKNGSIKSTELAEAMFKAGIKGAESEVLENRDILNFLG